MIERILKWDFESIDWQSLLSNALITIAVIVICWLVAKVLKRSIRRANRRIKNFDDLLVPVLSNIGTFLVYAVGVVVILDIFGVNTNSLIALLGAAGIAVGLALKDTLQNFAAGIMLLILRPFKTGDFIECGSLMGTVKEVNVFTSVLETPDGLYIFAPNGSLWGSPVKNYSRNEKRRLDLIIGISYGDSIERGISVLQEIIANEPRLLADPPPQVMVQSLADSSVNLQLRAWANITDYWNLYWELNRTMKEKIEEAGLTIPFPQRDVYIRK